MYRGETALKIARQNKIIELINKFDIDRKSVV